MKLLHAEQAEFDTSLRCLCPVIVVVGLMMAITNDNGLQSNYLEFVSCMALLMALFRSLPPTVRRKESGLFRTTLFYLFHTLRTT